MARPRLSAALSAGFGALVAIWAILGHGRPVGGALFAGLAFFALGVGTVAVFRARPHPLLAFVILGSLYFLALTGLRWVTGAPVSPADGLGAVLYGAVLTWMLRAQRRQARRERRAGRRGARAGGNGRDGGET